MYSILISTWRYLPLSLFFFFILLPGFLVFASSFHIFFPSPLTLEHQFLMAQKPFRITGNSITLEDALSFESGSTCLVDGDRLTEQRQAAGEETHILTFAELKALIEQGKTDGIPNNKLIPNILNVSPPLVSSPPSGVCRAHSKPTVF